MKMEKSSWSYSRLYTRCFLILASIAIWWMLFVFHFSMVSQPHDDSSVLSSSETPLIQLSQRTESLRSSLILTPQKLSSLDTSLDQIPKRPPPSPQPFWRALASIHNKSDPCAGKYVYMHDLPPEYNQELLDNCRQLNPWTNMCKFTDNAGLGPPLEDTEGVIPSSGWFSTNQFAVDVIFHNRMKQYECLTKDSGKAAITYVPFYAGLDISRHLWGDNVSVRDSGPLRLASWLQSRPEWKIMGGRDHFLVGGRITWDFRRMTDNENDWGNKLLYIPAVRNMSMLVIEASPYHTNDFGIPYPTYFHPSKDSDILDWQHRVRNEQRPALFSFAGAPRPEIATSIRGQIMEQCKVSKFCRLLECDRGESKCHLPSTVIKLFQESVFCLQPQGDSFTRRSIFDSMLAGCIPVFFHPYSAYSQYIWHLPQNHSEYSVYISEDDVRDKNVSIEDVLLKVSPEEVQRMREVVIKLIPGLVYADPRHRLTNMKDAFDVTVQALIDEITDLRIRIMEGRDDEDLEARGKGVEGLGKADLKEAFERVTRRWEGKRRNGEEHEWTDTSLTKPMQTGGSTLKGGKERSLLSNSLEEIWRRDQAEKEVRSKGSNSVTTQRTLDSKLQTGIRRTLSAMEGNIQREAVVSKHKTDSTAYKLRK